MSMIERGALVLVLGVLLSACAQEEPGEAGEIATMEDTTAVAPAPEGIALADVAGTWIVNATSETGQAVPQFELIATADPAGWIIQFPDRDPVPVTIVEVAGDSIVTQAGPYESVLRPGVQVTTHAVYRLEGDRLVGTTQAHYQTAEADSVITVHSEATRAEAAP